MEQLLLKLARQLDSLDEDSLNHLWGKYAAIVSQFEPTKRWQEAALVLSFIQAKHWKNQLFNVRWAAQSKPDKEMLMSGAGASQKFLLEQEAVPHRAKVSQFEPLIRSENQDEQDGPGKQDSHDPHDPSNAPR